MAKLWFENAAGNRRIIADCENQEQVSKAIKSFIEQANKGRPKNKKFHQYYTRMWVENGQTCYDVGSHVEFFYWDHVKGVAK